MVLKFCKRYLHQKYAFFGGFRVTVGERLGIAKRKELPMGPTHRGSFWEILVEIGSRMQKKIRVREMDTSIMARIISFPVLHIIGLPRQNFA